MVLTVTEFLGHLHPVLVHLPIGILLLVCLFLWLSRKEKFTQLRPAVPIILWLGMISAIVTCITGYLLSLTGDYDEDLVGIHQWMGISVAILSILLFLLNKKNRLGKWEVPVVLFLAALILVTGHLGGSLTHGSDYLTKPLENIFGEDSVAVIKRKPIPDIQQALVYADVIEPIFQSKCYGCHSAAKQKGKLRLDKTDLILKGGKDGVIIIPGNAAESELIKRIITAREEEHHMPPKEKPQLKEKETALLEWWINSGADFTKKVKDIQQPEKIKPILKSLEIVSEEKRNPPAIPALPVEKGDDKAISSLKAMGIVVQRVSQNSNYLSADFITAPDFNDKDISLLLPLEKQLVWLNLGHTAITDSSVSVLSQFLNLTELQLDHTHISDAGTENLKGLENLQSLNLVATRVTAAGLLKLSGLKKLRHIYLYQSGVDKKDWSALQKAFPKTQLDSGGYTIPYIKTDTELVKPPVMKR